ncbi:uncharacterized protein METZ01_LOCUS303689, partial [marine metagenome]
SLHDSAPVEVPDFRDEAVRKQYENDHWSPDPIRGQADRPPASILGDITPTDAARALAKEVWAGKGYYGV